MYPKEIVQPLKEELTSKGFTNLDTPEQVADALAKQGTTLLVINSVCGCAAGAARPGALASLQGDKKPDNLATVFAGYDTDAVKAARERLMPFPPSSPSIALFKDGELVHMLERHHIEGHSAKEIAEHLQEVYQHFVN